MFDVNSLTCLIHEEYGRLEFIILQKPYFKPAYQGNSNL